MNWIKILGWVRVIMYDIIYASLYFMFLHWFFTRIVWPSLAP